MNRLLIANRGEIARRIIRTARGMGIATVAVYSDADARALHVREADCAVALGATESAHSYLRADKIIAAARASGADAVHPGYGFLSENADFAQAVADAGLTWVGPPAAAIRALGSKSSAKLLAREHGVPVLPGYQGAQQDDERFVREAQQVGYPLMVKAAAGGGGRGMRLVMQPADLVAALASARAEAQASFGSAELLIERALLAPRHVEVQIFADTHGNCLHLGERDCSVQRRHQKIVEESPSPAVDAILRERMGKAAVALARAAGYVGAGTVEFLLEDDAGPGGAQGAAFHLMEMNTRLQVEHPVTELRLGVDLVRWQIGVARGEPLPMTQAQVDAALQSGGHAIEVRLCAEDDQFMPRTGTVVQFTAPPGLRFDHALKVGGQVTPHYDSMLGKLVAHAPTRDQAVDALARGLDQTVVLGLPTNRALLAAILRHEVFRAGRALIPFTGDQGPALRTALAGARQAMALRAMMAVYMNQHVHGADHRLGYPFPRPLRMRWHDADASSAGQLLNATALTLADHAGSDASGRERPQAHPAVRFEVQTGPDSTQTWLVSAARVGGSVLHMTVDGVSMRAEVALLEPGGGTHGTALVHDQTHPQMHVQIDGVDLWLEDLSLAPARQGGTATQGDVKAPFNGRVAQVAAQVGQHVARGETLVVIESMKLQHNLAATTDGQVCEVLVEAGQQVGPGQTLVRVQPAGAT